MVLRGMACQNPHGQSLFQNCPSLLESWLYLQVGGTRIAQPFPKWLRPPMENVFPTGSCLDKGRGGGWAGQGILKSSKILLKTFVSLPLPFHGALHLLAPPLGSVLPLFTFVYLFIL